MEYRRFASAYYIRMDRGDEIIGCILELCRRENIRSAVFSGIGGCSSAEIQTFIPETGEFETRTVTGMLELASMNGSVVTGEDGAQGFHIHGVFAYKEDERHCTAAGHLRSVTVRYTAEIELRPVVGGSIGRRFDEETGSYFWDFG